MTRLLFRRETGLMGVLLIVCVVNSLLSPYFMDAENLLDLSRHLAEAGIIACGMTLIIMTGGIDLSVGSILAVSGIVLGYSWQMFGPAVALPAAMLTGLACGAFNGLLITRWSLPPLVVTLATMSLFRGAAMVISQAKPVSDFPDWFTAFGQVPIAHVPKQLLVWFGLVVAFGVAAERTPLGRYAAAIGDKERAAIFAALPVNRIKFMLYTMTGLLSALAAAIFTSRVSTAKADAGMGLELEAITAVVLGGTAITGGRGTVLGSFIGVVILGFLRNGLTLAGIGSVWQQMIAGLILIATAILNQWLIGRASRRPATHKAAAAA